MKKLNNYNRICIGTANFGQKYGFKRNIQITTEEIEKILSLASFNKINTIDTANSYGESENIIGSLGHKHWNIITKIPSIPNGKIDLKQWTNDNIENSLKDLKKNCLYGVLFHNSNDLFSPKGQKVYEEIIKLKDKKIINKVGVSIYNPLDLSVLFKKFDFEIVQVPFNVLDRRVATSGWLKKLNARNVEIHARSIFLQGMLLKSNNHLPHYFNKWEGKWEKWNNWLKQKNVSALCACLYFVLSYTEIKKLVLGIDNQNHLNDIISALAKYQEIKLPDLSSNDELLINPMKWKLN